MRHRKIDLLRVTALLVIALAIAYFYLNIFSPQSIPRSLRVGVLRKPVNILILGTDITFDRETHKPMPEREGRADTILLTHIDPINGRVSVLSIPRDTYLEIPGYGMMKINVAHAYEGVPLMKDTVEHFSGQKIDYYLKVKPTAITKFVDQLGGIELDVEEDMRYVDHAQGLNINIKKGRQKLLGKQAHDYIRYRDNFRGDIARIGRQQKFLKALLVSLVKPENILRAPLAVRTCLQEVDTNLPPNLTLRILNWARTLELSQVNTLMAPGEVSFIRGAGSVWLPDMTALETEVKELF